MKNLFSVSLAVGLAVMACSPALGAPKVTKQTVVGRWLRVQAPTGNVAIEPPLRKANPGDRLSKVGDQLITGKDASAELWIDDGIGSLEVGESTTVLILRLERLRNGAKRTQFAIKGGTVKLRLRTLRNPKSNVQIFTPAGTAAVRGTIFGVSLNGKGISGVATLKGSVVVTGQGQKLPVRAGFARVLVPGKPPSKLRGLAETARIFDIHYQHLESGQVLLRANTDPGNLVQVDGQPIDIDEQGNFQTLVSNVQEHL
ncbi:MAG: FecR domain-containing protein, partial [Anaerolineae bacterium]|nr:FecR domain-containing protein [Gloeobacterales cyanobacterium ES-bin-313]